MSRIPGEVFGMDSYERNLQRHLVGVRVPVKPHIPKAETFSYAEHHARQEVKERELEWSDFTLYLDEKRQGARVREIVWIGPRKETV